MEWRKNVLQVIDVPDKKVEKVEESFGRICLGNYTEDLVELDRNHKTGFNMSLSPRSSPPKDYPDTMHASMCAKNKNSVKRSDVNLAFLKEAYREGPGNYLSSEKKKRTKTTPSPTKYDNHESYVVKTLQTDQLFFNKRPSFDTSHADTNI